MSYRDYNQYLGSRRCCDFRGQGPEGPTGPTGPAAVGPPGPTGPAGFSPGFISLTLIDEGVTIPYQSTPIANYSLNIEDSTLRSITFTYFPPGYQANIFINAVIPGTLNYPVTGINFYNYSSPIVIDNATIYRILLKLYNDGTYIYAESTTFGI